MKQFTNFFIEAISHFVISYFVQQRGPKSTLENLDTRISCSIDTVMQVVTIWLPPPSYPMFVVASHMVRSASMKVLFGGISVANKYKCTPYRPSIPPPPPRNSIRYCKNTVICPHCPFVYLYSSSLAPGRRRQTSNSGRRSKVRLVRHTALSDSGKPA
jgi:hypothetical protein